LREFEGLGRIGIDGNVNGGKRMG